MMNHFYLGLLIPFISAISFNVNATETVTELKAKTQVKNKSGKELYHYHCIACHGEGMDKPGTVALNTKYNGSLPAQLDQRTDLSEEFIKHFVRKGVSTMAPFRRVELSNGDLKKMTHYLLDQKNKPQ